MIDCSKCGHSNPSGSNFCSWCGERLAPPPAANDATRVIPVVDEDSTRMDLSPEIAAAVGALPAGNALLVVTRGPEVGERFLLDQQETRAGRSPESEIFLDDITVSRHHAKFLIRDSQMVIEDEGSLNGTYVNRTLVDGSTVLRPGDEVQIGKFRMVYFVSEHGLR